MLIQGIIKVGDGIAFIDQCSELCVDGKPCDINGDIIYSTDKGQYKERDFKQYRKYSPEFRQTSIKYWFINNHINLLGESCSCSKCGTGSMDNELYKLLRM